MDCDDTFQTNSLSFDSNLDSLIDADYDLGLELPFPSHSQMSTHENEGVDIAGAERERVVKTTKREPVVNTTEMEPVVDTADRQNTSRNTLGGISVKSVDTEKLENLDDGKAERNSGLCENKDGNVVKDAADLLKDSTCFTAVEKSITEKKVGCIEQLDLANLKEKRRKRLAGLDKTKDKIKTIFENLPSIQEKMGVNVSKKRKVNETDEPSEQTKKQKATTDDNTVKTITQKKVENIVSIEKTSEREQQQNTPERYTNTTDINMTPDIAVKKEQQIDETNTVDQDNHENVAEGTGNIQKGDQTEETMPLGISEINTNIKKQVMVNSGNSGQSGANIDVLVTDTRESKLPTDTHVSKSSTGTHVSKSSTDTHGSKSSTDTHGSKSSTDTHGSKPPTDTHVSKSPADTHESKSPAVTGECKSPMDTDESKPPTDTCESKSPEVDKDDCETTLTEDMEVKVSDIEETSSVDREELTEIRSVASDATLTEKDTSEFDSLDEFIAIDYIGEDSNDDFENENSSNDLNGDADVNDDDDEEEDFDDFYMDENEVDAWLEEGVKKRDPRKRTNDPSEVTEETDLGNGKYLAKQKHILKEKGENPFEVLPEGWLRVVHNSGMPVYLHKNTRVISMSRPYFIGHGSVRRHEMPITSIPCLHYKRALEKEAKQASETAKDESTTDQNNPTQKQNGTASQDQNRKSQEGNGLSDIPTPVVTTAENVAKDIRINADELLSYCNKLFQFRTLTVKKFQTWREKRAHLRAQYEERRRQLPQMAKDTKLIICPIPESISKTSNKKKKELVINPEGKSSVCILHEYTQHVLRVQPVYEFAEIENMETPYKATINIDGISYGAGVGSCKRKAKAEAAKSALKVFIPQLAAHWKDTDSKGQNTDVSYFEEVSIEDPRVADLCDRAALPKPYHILTECLRRNFGMGDTDLHVDKKLISNQKTEFSIKVGKHLSTVIAKNKLEGKQRAAQGMLQKLHPKLKSWASMLRLYNKTTDVAYHERDEEIQQQPTEKDNTLLDKLKEAMRKSRYLQGQLNRSNFNPDMKQGVDL